jgi:hypothetical protein
MQATYKQVCYFHTSNRKEDSPTFPAMLLQFVEKQQTIGFRRFFNARHTQNKTKGHVVFAENVKKKWEDCGPSTSGFQVRAFVSTEAKHHTQQLPKLRKVTSTSGFRSSGFREYRSQTSHTTTPEIVKSD